MTANANPEVSIEDQSPPENMLPKRILRKLLKQQTWKKIRDIGGTVRLSYYGEFLRGNKRNQPCLCGSNKKFKHCCIEKIMKAAQGVPQPLETPDQQVEAPQAPPS
jgi:uncharacterized protein YecA (UPF0149 family)